MIRYSQDLDDVNERIPAVLRNAIGNRKLAVFIGAGASRGATNSSNESPPSWADFVLDIARELNTREARSIMLDLQNTENLPLNFPKILETLLRGKSEFERARMISKIVDGVQRTDRPNWKDRDYGDNPDFFGATDRTIHSALAELEPRLIVTTNYDTVIERYHKADAGKLPFAVFTGMGTVLHRGHGMDPQDPDLNPEEFTLGDALRHMVPTVVKLHGDGQYGQDLVVTESDYLRAYRPGGHLVDFLRHLFSNYVVLFVGYSLSDYDLKMVLNTAEAPGNSTGGNPVLLSGNCISRYVMTGSPETELISAQSFREEYGARYISVSDSSDYLNFFQDLVNCRN